MKTKQILITILCIVLVCVGLIGIILSTLYISNYAHVNNFHTFIGLVYLILSVITLAIGGRKL